MVARWKLALMAVAFLGAMPTANAQSYAPVQAPSAANTMDKPLVLLRFNQRSMNYERSLYLAVSKAVETKPAVMFDVISMVPQRANPQANIQWQQAANQHAQQVMRSMNNIGVPQSRIRYRAQPSPGLSHDEVHIFVR